MDYLLKSKKFQLGFTLIELLIVIVIIAILVASGAVSYSFAARNARDATRKSDLKKIASALEQYYADNRQYPPPNPPSIVSVSTEPQPWIIGLDKYMSVIPVDPKNTTSPVSLYEYVVFNNRQFYLLMTNLENNGDPERRVYIGPGNVKSPCNERPWYNTAGSFRPFVYDWCVSSPNS